MSRGPGRWQRAILAALGGAPLVTLTEVGRVEAGGELTRSDLAGLHRAVGLLAQRGILVAAMCWVEDDAGRLARRTMLARPEHAAHLRARAVDATEEELEVGFWAAIHAVNRLSATQPAAPSGVALSDRVRDDDGDA